MSPEEIESAFALLEEKMKVHDWDYGYSDDYSVWRRGQDKMDEIHNFGSRLSLIDKERVNNLYKKYRRL